MVRANRRNKKYLHTAHKVSRVQLTEAEMLTQLEELENPFILIIDRIQDPHNLGACLRSAEAAGIDIVIAPQKHTVGITETVRNISCGAADTVPYVQVPNLNRTIEQIKKLEITLIATGDEESQLIYDVDLSGPLGIVMGSEAHGVRQKTAEKCDHLVRIPMLGSVDCLNLSVATGVCLFEAVRQRM